MRYLILLVIVLAFVGCDCPKKATTQTTTTTDNNYRFNVSFISKGAGTDINAKKQFDQYLSEYEKKNKVKLEYETTNWGMEGEIDYCFKLTALDQKKQDQFIMETKEVLKGSTLVRYSENAPCRQKNK